MNSCKRQKVSSTCLQFGGKNTSFTNTHCNYTLETLPPEVLEMILRFLPYCDIASSVRLVSRKCLIISTSILNTTFLSAGRQLELAMAYIETNLPKLKTKLDLLAWTRAFNILELIKAQYQMLKAVTWRYTHPPKNAKFARLSFYAGSLLDELQQLIAQAKTRPWTLTNSNGPVSSVVHFIGLCKRFMNYFEKVSERKINRSALTSGCKAVDLLDCLTEGRQVLGFRVTAPRGNRDSIVTMKLRYTMKRSWFTCLRIPNENNERSWRDEQRFMYLRLRRLVGSINEHLFERVHYERELLLEISSFKVFARKGITIAKPPASTYSGYGEYGGRFFYYGNMNKFAYDTKFKVNEYQHDFLEEDPENIERDNVVQSVRTNAPPSLDLIMTVEIRCSPELAPVAVRDILKSDYFDDKVTSDRRQEIYLKLNVFCPASNSNRLPGTFTWELKSPPERRNHFKS